MSVRHAVVWMKGQHPRLVQIRLGTRVGLYSLSQGLMVLLHSVAACRCRLRCGYMCRDCHLCQGILDHVLRKGRRACDSRSVCNVSGCCMPARVWGQTSQLPVAHTASTRDSSHQMSGCIERQHWSGHVGLLILLLLRIPARRIDSLLLAHWSQQRYFVQGWAYANFDIASRSLRRGGCGKSTAGEFWLGLTGTALWSSSFCRRIIANNLHRPCLHVGQ